MCDLVKARQNAVIRTTGARRVVRKGQVLCVDDPAVAGRESLFEPARVEHYCGNPKSTPVVEQATAAPGERRTVSGPRRPPTSGPGSGVDAWRRYAAAATGEPAESWDTLSREEIIERLDSEPGGRA